MTQVRRNQIDTNLINGWIDANETWTYASASTITVPSGAASIYQKGDRIKWTQTTVKYGVIVAVADTVLTIAVNTDYTVANAAITANYYSHAMSPVGYPNCFNWTTTGGGGTSITGGGCRYSVTGNVCTLSMQSLDGTSNSTGKTITIPIPTSASLNPIYATGFCFVKDNGAQQTVVGQIQLSASDSTADVYKTWYQGAWTSSGAFSIYIPHLIYEF